MLHRPLSNRSVLYVPASNSRAVEKILAHPEALQADAIIFDLEDAVTPGQKGEAREALCRLLRQKPNRARCLIRINALNSEWFEADLRAVLRILPDAIVLPKVGNPEDIVRITGRLKAYQASETIHLWAMIETPEAVLNVASIAACAAMPESRLEALLLGVNDLALSTGAELQPGRAAYLPWIMQCLLAARGYGLALIDGVYTALEDQKGFAKECAEAAAWGLDGKSLIHPSQIAPCNAAFRPDKQTIEEAHAICTAFAKPENAGRAVLRVNGKMVEELHLKQAQRLLKRAGF